MNKRLVLSGVLTLLVLLGVNVAVFVPLVQERGLQATAAMARDTLYSVLPSATGADELQQFACSEVERAEAGVWPLLNHWIIGAVNEPPPLANIRTGLRILENAQNLGLRSAQSEWIANRAAVLGQFSEGGFESDGAAAGKALSSIIELNSSFEDFCAVETYSASYKGFIVTPTPNSFGLIMRAQTSEFGGDQTPVCYFPVPDSQGRTSRLIELTVAVHSESLTDEEVFTKSLGSLNQDVESETKLGWAGAVTEGSGQDSEDFYVFDFKPVDSGTGAPTTYSCRVKFQDKESPYVEESLSVSWK